MTIVDKVEDVADSPLFNFVGLCFLVGGGYSKYALGKGTWNPWFITGCTMAALSLAADMNSRRKWRKTASQYPDLFEAHYRDEELLWQDDFETAVPVPGEEGLFAATRINEPDVTYFVREETLDGEDLFRIIWIEEEDEPINVVTEMAADWGGMSLTGGIDEMDEMLGKKKKAESFKDWADDEEKEHGDVSFDKWVQEEYEEPAHMHSNPLTFIDWARQEHQEAGHAFDVESYDEKITVWICGACNRRFEDQNDAEACCEGLEEDEIPYFDGRSKELREVHIHEAEYYIHSPDEYYGPYDTLADLESATQRLEAKGIKIRGITRGKDEWVAETMGPPEEVAKEKRVRTLSGKPHVQRKLKKDQNITPEEARKRVRFEAQQNPAAGEFHPSEIMGEQIIRPDGPMTPDQAKGFLSNLRNYRKTMAAEGENEEVESIMDLIMEIAVEETLFNDLEYYFPEEWYQIYLSSYDDPDNDGYQIVVIHEDDFDDFIEMREALRYLPPSPTSEYESGIDLETFWDEEAGE